MMVAQIKQVDVEVVGNGGILNMLNVEPTGDGGGLYVHCEAKHEVKELV